MLMKRGIEDNPDKFQVDIAMRSPTNVTKVQQPIGYLALYPVSLHARAARPSFYFFTLKKKFL